ncbi:MAG: 1-acyl-sn-glycerol-3-phosphate acyltransferase [Deltaproteobacteria bacterium]|nr:1-acyl-sn-glycerol-3-phosphate acyltransferase [Deltaproteobacteria bacterium]
MMWTIVQMTVLGGFQFMKIFILMVFYAPFLYPMEWFWGNLTVWRFLENRFNLWGKELMANLGTRIEILGLENLPTSGPFLLMANHQSNLDIPLLVTLPRPVAFVAKKQLFYIPVLTFWMRRLGCVSLDREDNRKALNRMKDWADHLILRQQGLIVFPEGTRTKDPEGKFGVFRRGSLRVSEEHNIPLVPVVLDGTRLLTQPAAWRAAPLGRRVVRMKIMPPRHPKPMPAPEAKAFMETLREDMIKTWEEIRVTWPVPEQKA